MFGVIFVFVFLLHAPLLRLPYFWDEAGYYVPAARDLLLTGSLIPRSTVSNAHPPLVMAWLALWWKVAGYAPLVTRTAMLVIAAFSLLGLFRLAERVANTQIAVASTLCTAFYPVFFAQSSLAQVDLAAAGLTFWGLAAYLEGETIATGFWFALAALAKETAILAPMALVCWEVVGLLARKSSLQELWLDRTSDCGSRTSSAAHRLAADPRDAACSLVHLSLRAHRIRLRKSGVLPLQRGCDSQLHPIFSCVGHAALADQRISPLVGFDAGDAAGDVSAAAAARSIWRAPSDSPSGANGFLCRHARLCGRDGARRRRGSGSVHASGRSSCHHCFGLNALAQAAFLASRCGVRCNNFRCGLVLEPSVWILAGGQSSVPDYILLHEDGEHFLEARYPVAQVLTAWPASDEISRPWLGYITRPMSVVRIENFSLDEVLAAASHSDYQVALVFSTKYEPVRRYGIAGRHGRN